MTVPPALKRDWPGAPSAARAEGGVSGGAEDNLAQPGDVGVSCPQLEQKHWPRPSRCEMGWSGPFVFPVVVFY